MKPTANMAPVLQSQLQNMSYGIKALCHSISCLHTDGECPHGERCSVGKAALKHIILCDSSTCKDARCAHYRVILEHYITCIVSV
jgi:hypothetical protein